MKNTIAKSFLLLCCCLSFYCSLNAQEHPLTFNEKGQFKIVQFTDVHFKLENPASDVAIERIQEVLDKEEPELVIFTGDVIYSSPADESMQFILNLVSSRKIPFAVTFGNHDDEQGFSRQQLYDLIRTIPYNLLPEQKKPGVFDYALEIYSQQNKELSSILYCMDSNSYSSVEGVDGYAWFEFDQIDWYRKQSMKYTEKNKGVPLPGLAFFHIPLPEYQEAITSLTTPLKGTRLEYICSPQLNSGMFTAMRQCGDVMGTFVGHDHDNDFAVMWHDILLAYGRFTGGNTEYNNLPNGARVIQLVEGQREFTTWIRLADDEIIDKATYPDSFVKKPFTPN